MQPSLTLYGITNCDTVRKARRWLEGQGIDYRYHDLRKDGLQETDLLAWIKSAGWEALVNRSGSTFRKLPEAEKQITTEAQAIALMLAHPTLIKRPVLAQGNDVTLGFKSTLYETLFTSDH